MPNNSLALHGGTPVREKSIPYHLPFLDSEDFESVQNTLKSLFISGDGPECKIFEKNLSEYLGVKHVFFTTSATAALDLAFMVKKFPPEAEVIVPNFTFTSTALAPILNNLKVVLVDVRADNGNIDISQIESKITKKTVAIAPIDYAGNPVEMNEINALARKHKLYVVHDTAQSIGSEYFGRKTGTLADVSTFSFHGTKNISIGEGGALVTNDDALADALRICRDTGTNKSFLKNSSGFAEYMSRGNSYVQSNILGALGISQLKKIETVLLRRAEIAQSYIQALQPYLSFIRLPQITEGAQTNWHIFYILLPPEYKDFFLKAMHAEGVFVNTHYHPLHLNTLYKNSCTFQEDEFPNSLQFYNSMVRIPLYPSLSDDDVQDIIEALHKVLSHIQISQ